MLPRLQPSRPSTTTAASSKPAVSPPLTHTRAGSGYSYSYNPAVRHPAFFTERLHKSAAGAGAVGSSPVTAGYTYMRAASTGTAGSKL